MKWFWVGLAGLVAGVIAVVVTYRTVPDHTTEATHFDTLIVLGSPADPDGAPSWDERERVMEAVREWKAGRADHIILSGGAAHNQWVEGAVMAGIAARAGVPANALEVEGQSLNTIQNIFYSHAIMERHGWRTAEVVSEASHLPRASLILEHWHFPWRVRACPWPAEVTWSRKAGLFTYEALGTTVLRWVGFRRTRFLPA